MQMELFLPAQIIVDELENRKYTLQFYSGKKTTLLNRYRLYTDSLQEQKAEDCLYIVPYREYMNFTQENCTLLVIGRITEPFYPNRTNSVIEIMDNHDLYDLINDLSEIFENYRTWDVQIKKAAEAGDIHKLGELGRSQFRNPIFLHDNRYNYIIHQQWTGTTYTTEDNLRTGLPAIPSTMQKEMMESKAFRNTMNTNGAFLYEDFPRVKNRILYVNLWNSQKQWNGRVCIEEIASSICPGQFYLAEYYAQIIQQALDSHKLILGTHFAKVKSVLSNIIDHMEIDQHDFIPSLEQIDMHLFDDYQLIVLTGRSHPLTENAANIICYDIEKSFSNSCAFMYKKDICVLLDYTNKMLDQTTLNQYFSQLDQEYSLNIGISNRFHQLYDLTDYYVQAARAMQLEPLSHKETRAISYFEDYSLENILIHGTQGLSLSHVISPALSILEDYDKENHTEFYVTLQIYLEQSGNIAKSAELLFIHRSTMTYRIEKIAKLTNLDLSNYKTRLYLSLSYYLNDVHFSPTE